MLVLTRKAGQIVLIGEDIEVVVISGKSSSGVRLGIKAPKDVVIRRGEVAESDGPNTKGESNGGCGS